MARTTASLNVLLALRTEGIGKALQVANKQLNAFAQQAKAAGEQMTMSFTLPAAVIGGSAIKAFADMEKLEKSLTAIAGSSEAAQQQLGRLRTLALEPGIDLEQAVQASIRLQTVGYAAEDAERTILQMSKAITLAGGTADDLNEVVRQMTQMESKNKILAEDFEVIKDRIPNIGLALQQAFGTTSIEAIRDSNISVREFNDRLVQAIATNQVYQSVQGGTANAITNFQSALRQALATVGKAINENANITAILDKLTGVVEKLANGFASLSPRMQSIIIYSAAFLAALGPVLFALGSFATILPTISNGVLMLKVAMTGLVGTFKLLGSGMLILLSKIPLVSSAVTYLSTALTVVRTNAAAAWLAMSGPIGWITAAVVALGAAVVIMYQKWDKFRGIVKGTGEALKTAAEGFEQSLRQGNRVDAAIFGAATPESTQAKGKTLGAAFAKGYNEGIADLRTALPTATDAETRRAGYDLAQQVTGRGMPFPFRRPTAAQTTTTANALPPAPLTDEQKDRAAFLRSKRRTDDMATVELPSLAPQILEAGKLALANDAVTISNIAMAESFADVTEGMSKAMPNFERINEIAFEMPDFMETLASATEKITDGFVSLAEQGSTSIQEFAVSAVKALRQVLGEVIRLGVANAIERSLKNMAISINPALIPVIAGAAGALAKTAFNSILNTVKVPALATGGLAYGPTMALVGDNPGARSNPEVIAPLSKLQGMLEQSNSMAIGEFRLRGEDLLLAVTRTTNRQNRYK